MKTCVNFFRIGKKLVKELYRRKGRGLVPTGNGFIDFIGSENDLWRNWESLGKI